MTNAYTVFHRIGMHSYTVAIFRFVDFDKNVNLHVNTMNLIFLHKIAIKILNDCTTVLSKTTTSNYVSY